MQTKFIATLGPASSSPAMIEKLIRAGVSVFRLNFSHGSHDEHGDRAASIRAAARKLKKEILILQDLSGLKIRIGQLAQPLSIKKNQKLQLICGATAAANPGEIPLPFRSFAASARVGQKVLMADGAMNFKVSKIAGEQIELVALNSGQLSSRKGVLVPGMDPGLSAITAKDLKDAEFGAKLKAEWVAASFVHSAADIRKLRKALAKFGSTAKIIAKIETRAALEKLEEIIEAADGIMVARGDLGLELEPWEVPGWQKNIVACTRRADKFCIVATQLLASMVTSPRPTRAEASDVFNAVLDGATHLMVSDETTVGEFPVEAVTMLRKTAGMAEHWMPTCQLPHREPRHLSLEM